jgi:hypothetical protein
MLLFFLLQPCRRQPTLPQAVCKHFLFLCLLTPFSQRQSLRQHGSFAILLFFLVDEVLKMFYKLKPWACKLPQPPRTSLYFEDYYGGIGLQKKLIRLPRKLRYNLWLMQGNQINFFRRCPSRYASMGIYIHERMHTNTHDRLRLHTRTHIRGRTGNETFFFN